MNVNYSIDSELKESLISETIRIAEIPAPPFLEDKRAEYMVQRFKEFGLRSWKDSLGNVLAVTPNIGRPEKIVVMSAHLDTVFESSVDTSVKRVGDFLYGPGVCDDSMGLAVLLHLAAVTIKDRLENQNVQVLFLATLGEEGLGDLRGIKHFFAAEEHRKITSKVTEFVTIDGVGASHVVTRGIGSKRYRVTYSGPGGHSFGSFGLVNPIYALSQVIVEISRWKVPEDPKTTFSVGVIEGGRSVNAIPDSASFLLDLRSEDNLILEELSSRLTNVVDKVCHEINYHAEGELTSNIEIVGDRPAGHTPHSTFLVRSLERANRMYNIPTRFASSSTDANIPMSLGVPAIAVSSVDVAANSHSLNEYLDGGESSLLVFRRNLKLLELLLDR